MNPPKKRQSYQESVDEMLAKLARIRASEQPAAARQPVPARPVGRQAKPAAPIATPAARRAKARPAKPQPPTPEQTALAEWRADATLQRCWPDAVRYVAWRVGDGADRPRQVLIGASRR
jgi:hypothetical protein